MVNKVGFSSPTPLVVHHLSWGRIAAAVSCIALAIFTYWVFFAPQTRALDGSAKFLAQLQAITQNAPKPDWDVPLKLNDRSYYAMGFLEKTRSFCAIVGSMRRDNRYHQIVHLMGKATRGNYLDNENQIHITSSELYLSKGKLGDKPFYNFHGWLDEVPFPNVQADLIEFVRFFSEEVEKGSVPLVDCRTGLEKTATFIAMVELARHRFKTPPPKDDELEGLMKGILQELAKTAKGRIPTMNQLKMVLDPSLLKKLVSL